MKSKFLIYSLVIFFIGFIFLILENSFYQFIDENGILHESYFMPLGFLFLFVGILGIIFYILKSLLKQMGFLK